MLQSLPLATLVLLGAVVLLAGLVNGVAGFGFALVGTMALATVVDPATAVVFMVLPILAVNLSLVRELSREDLRTCSSRFGPLVVAAVLGTVVGMAVLDRLPAAPLRVGLGLLTVGFVANAVGALDVPGRSSVEERCFVETTPAMLGVGALSGGLFGATNVGVQVVAYLRSCDLSHRTFVGVVALVFVGVNAVRVGAASLLGLYGGLGVVVVSLTAAIPAVVGVALGSRLRYVASETVRRRVVLGLQTVIGARLLLGGLGVL